MNNDIKAMIKLRGLTQAQVAAFMPRRRRKDARAVGMSLRGFAAVLARDLSSQERLEVMDAIERAANAKK